MARSALFGRNIHTLAAYGAVDAHAYNLSFLTTVRAGVTYVSGSDAGTWPLLADTDGRMLVDVGLVRLPATFIIDPDGRVVAHLLRSSTGKATCHGRHGAGHRASGPLCLVVLSLLVTVVVVIVALPSSRAAHAV